MKRTSKRKVEYAIFRLPDTEHGNMTRWLGGFATLAQVEQTFAMYYQHKKQQNRPEFVIGRVTTEILGRKGKEGET